MKPLWRKEGPMLFLVIDVIDIIATLLNWLP